MKGTLMSLSIRNAAAMAAFAALALAGCSSTEAATTASPSPSPSTSPSPTGPQVREAAWSTDLGVELWSTPVAAGDVVLVGGIDGTLFALDAADGTLAWEVQTGGALRGPAAV